jgi:hypothetical protein
MHKQFLLFISTETTTDKGCIITPLDRASFQLQKTTVPHIHHHWLRILASDEQEPAHWTPKNLHQRRRPTFSQLQWWRRFQENIARVVHFSSSRTDVSRKASIPNCTLGEAGHTSRSLQRGLAFSCSRRKAVFSSGLNLVMFQSCCWSVWVPRNPVSWQLCRAPPGTWPLYQITVITAPTTSQPSMNVNGYNLFRTEEFNDTLLLRMHFHIRRHFARLLLCCCLPHDNKTYQLSTAIPRASAPNFVDQHIKIGGITFESIF